MALVDTADSVLMTGAYGWAFVKPIRKLYYNLIITSLVGRDCASRRHYRGFGVGGR